MVSSDWSTLPLILSASKYFRYISLSFYICRGQNEHFSMNSVRKTGRVELCQIFHPSNWCTDICKTIFVILKVRFHHEDSLRLFNLHSFCSGSGDVLPSPPIHESEAETRPFLRLTAAIPPHSLTFLLSRLLSVQCACTNNSQHLFFLMGETKVQSQNQNQKEKK